MAEFRCEKHPYLSFYVAGKRKTFRNGRYKTTVRREIDVLEKMDYVTRLDSEPPSNLGKFMEKEEKPKKKSTTTKKK